MCARTPTLYPYPWFTIGLGPDGWLFLQVAQQDGLPAESVPSFPGTGAAECDFLEASSQDSADTRQPGALSEATIDPRFMVALKVRWAGSSSFRRGPLFGADVPLFGQYGLSSLRGAPLDTVLPSCSHSSLYYLDTGCPRHCCWLYA